MSFAASTAWQAAALSSRQRPALESSGNRERAAQLVSRVGIKHHLRHPARADILTLAQTLIRKPVGRAARNTILSVASGVGASHPRAFQVKLPRECPTSVGTEAS